MLALASTLSPLAASAAHPLLTEDTGTQGAGNYQLELTHDLAHDKDATTRTRTRSISAVLSVGLTETLDLIATLPHDRTTERAGAVSTTVQGYADAEIAAKWRYYDVEGLSLALRPGLGLPTANEDKGLGSGHLSPSIFAVLTYARSSWTYHLHAGYTRNFFDGAAERRHLYHGSAAVEYSVSDTLRLVGDASVETNAERAGHPTVGSMVVGLVYTLTPDLDLDFGYRKGWTDAAADHAWLTGVAWRF